MPPKRSKTTVYAVLFGAALLLVGTLATRLPTRMAPSNPTAPTSPNGRALMGELGCLSCHAIAGQGGNLGPEMGSELAAKGQVWLYRYMSGDDYIDVYPGNGHVAFLDMSLNQAKAIADFLADLSVPAQYRGPQGSK